MDFIYFSEEDFSRLPLEEIKALGNNVNKIKIGKEFLIFYLIRNDKIEILKNLIEYSGGPSTIDLNIRDSVEYTPLLEACYRNNFKMVTLLLSRGANINIKGNYEATPLYWSCRHGNFEMIKLLLENGAIPYVNEKGNYECLKSISIKEEDKEKLRDFIFKIQSLNIKKVK